MRLACLLPALLLLQAVPTAGGGAAGVRPPKNAVLIVVDTLRADHVGAYGYHRDTTPNVDRLARESVLFENAFSQSSQSLVSHSTLFTGRFPRSHGVLGPGQRLPVEEKTLAEVLKSRNFRTAAFTGGFFVSAMFGLGQGFETFDDRTLMGGFDANVPKALEWISKDKDSPFFLFLHGYDCHSPYGAPERSLDEFTRDYDGFLRYTTVDHSLGDRIFGRTVYTDASRRTVARKLTDADIRYLIARYDGSIRHADQALGKFLQALEKRGLMKDTLVVLAADHGEALLEHGRIAVALHGGLYEEALHVPLLMRIPGRAAARIPNQVQLVDVMPTVLDLLRVPIPKAAQGRSLAPLIAGKAGASFNKYVYAQSLSPRQKGGGIDTMVRAWPWKLMHDAAGYRLFNLEEDPGEAADLYSERPAVARRMRREMKRWMARTPESSIRRSSGRVPAVLRERMRKDGYWWLETGRPKERP